MSRRILLLYITAHSGHHHAAMAIEGALRHLEPSVEVLAVDAAQYTNPILARVINRTYLGIIKNRPEVWEYLYDNPRVLRRVRALREMIHRHNSSKLDDLIQDFRPQAVVCTQAFPCGMVAEYKNARGLTLPLIGVLTDYAPHSYWLFDNVDAYVVPCREAREHLVAHGIEPSRVHVLGIPIALGFNQVAAPAAGDLHGEHHLDRQAPLVLVMGGSQGLGPLVDAVSAIDRLAVRCQQVVVTGSNRRLRWALQLRRRRFRKRVVVLEYTKQIPQWMNAATLLVSKPGGVTTAEALAKRLPMVILHPIPGQETKNTLFLLQHRAAVKAATPHEAAWLVDELLRHPAKLAQMREATGRQAHPESSLDIAKLALSLAATS